MIYLAAGWFSEDQDKALTILETCCDKAGVETYSPRREFKFVPGMSPTEVLDQNIDKIESSSLILVSTEGKDMGTLFECGYAYAIGKDIVYYYPSSNKMNLMLSATARAVIGSESELLKFLKHFKETGKTRKTEWKGEIE